MIYLVIYLIGLSIHLLGGVRYTNYDAIRIVIISIIWPLALITTVTEFLIKRLKK